MTRRVTRLALSSDRIADRGHVPAARPTKGLRMNRKSRLLLPLGFALLALLAAPASHAQIATDPGALGTCTVGNICSIETRLPGEDLCSDGIDNDGNGYCDTGSCGGGQLADPHCLSEVLCQDGFDNDDEGGADGADLDCQCLVVAATAAGGTGFGGNSCTAKDLSISYTAEPIVSNGCINPTDFLRAQIFAEVTMHQAQARYDLGLWMALDGTSALTGSRCTRQILQPVSSTAPDPTAFDGQGPFWTLEGDLCGDGPSATLARYQFPYAVNVRCTDQLPNGFIDLGQCGSWDNNSNQPNGSGTCNVPSDAVPGTSSKCRCLRSESGVPGPNIRTACGAFSPSGVGDTLDVGETADYTLSFTNSVTGCTPDTPTDAFGRNRCGTASFVRFAIRYGNADDVGDFYYDNGSGDEPVPECPIPPATTPTPAVVGPNNGVLCNDTANNRLIWAPSDPNPNNVYGVVSATANTISLPFRYDLTSAPLAPISLDAEIYWDDAIDTNPTNSAITPAEAVDLTGAILQTCSDCSCSNSASTTPITLSSFHATPAGRGVQFDWTTETEVGNVGFDLYAVVDGERVKLTDHPIPTAGIDSLEAQSYSQILPVPAGAEEFVIEDVDLRGRAKAHGPFRLDARYGSEARNAPIDWDSVRRDNGLHRGENARALGRDRLTRSGSRTSRGGSKGGGGSTPTVIELLVDRDGLYRVTYEDLLAAGFDLASESASQLGLSARGVAVPMFVSTTGKFGPGSYLEFWGDAIDTLYSDTNVYRLATAQKRPARVVESSEAPSGATAETYLETRKFERERGYAYWSPADDPFFDTEMLVFGSAGQWSFPFEIDAFVPAAGAATLRVSLFGGTSWRSVLPDHHVELFVNGVPVGESSFDGTTGVDVEVPIPEGVLANGANTLVVRLPGDTGAAFDLVSLDEFSVDYPRAFDATGGALRFVAAGDRYEVSGVGADAVAYRRSGGVVERLVGAVSGGFVASIPGRATASEYAVAEPSALLSPATIQLGRPAADLTTGPASLLVISHAAFLDAVEPLVAARIAEGYSVKVVDVEDVYARYAHGIFDAEAIRAYVADAYATLGTRYVLLVGGDSYDYRNHLNLGAVSFMPSLYRRTGELIAWAPSDPAYADVDGDGVQDLAIGRIPARTVSELEQVIAKTLAYGARTYLDTGIFAADYADPGANESFLTASDRLVDKLPTEWQVDRIYLDLMPLADARAALFADLASGASLTQYTGHSGLRSWGSGARPQSQHLFRIGDVATMPNLDRPTVVSQLGCWNVYYASPTSDSIGNRLLAVPGRGAAAVLGAATLTADVNGNRFGARLAPHLISPGMPIGEAVRLAKRELVATAPPDADLRDVLLGWIVLGDPTLRVEP